MRLRPFLMGALIFGSFLSPCQAGLLHPLVVKTQKCLQNPENTTQDTVTCYVEAGKGWDKELNIVYQTLTHRMSPAAKASLKKAQETWLTFRDQQFKFFETYYGSMEGTIWASVAAQMKADVVKDRVMALYSILDSTDMSGETSKNYRFESDQ